jgi:methylmalonyl-CoA mutase cobalamin-binding domain/chain
MSDVTRVLLAQLTEAEPDLSAVARLLRDAGFDVVYGGLFGSVDDLVQAALQEDVGVVGVIGAQGSGEIQLADVTVVELPETMTVEDAVAAIKSAGGA